MSAANDIWLAPVGGFSNNTFSRRAHKLCQHFHNEKRFFVFVDTRANISLILLVPKESASRLQFPSLTFHSVSILQFAQLVLT